jgi:hypothetical protein
MGSEAGLPAREALWEVSQRERRPMNLIHRNRRRLSGLFHRRRRLLKAVSWRLQHSVTGFEMFTPSTVSLLRYVHSS